VILLDTTVLSNFARIERLDLLRLALPKVATTPQVMAELREGVAVGHLPDCDWQWVAVVALTFEEEGNLARVRLILDDGEASCIAVALAAGIGYHLLEPCKGTRNPIFKLDLEARSAYNEGNPGISIADSRQYVCPYIGKCIRSVWIARSRPKPGTWRSPWSVNLLIGRGHGVSFSAKEV